MFQNHQPEDQFFFLNWKFEKWFKNDILYKKKKHNFIAVACWQSVDLTKTISAIFAM